MLNMGKKIVRLRIPILIISFLLLFPSGFMYLNTRINYDILSYLPENIDTMKGQEILLDEFGTGAFSLCVVEGMGSKEVAGLKKNIETVEHVKNVIWYDTLSDVSVPMEVLPEDIVAAFNNKEKGSTLLMVLFDTSSSADETLEAIEEIRSMTKKQCQPGGMSAIITDMKEISNSEALMYVVIAAGLTTIVLALTMDSFLIPVFFLLSIGMAIIYNLGSNFVAGEISFITQALAAVLQLAVTMDYSIFLWHSYQEYREKYPEDNNRAMSHAISNTIVSVVGSSITTVAGFAAMCFMTFTLGLDLGIVMAKGVIIGVIGCVTIFPSMILVFDKAIEKTKHRPVIPDLGKIGNFVTKKYRIFIALFLIILGPALYGYTHNEVYYDLAGTLPKDLGSVMANSKLKEDYGMGASHMILADSRLPARESKAMLNEIKRVEGVRLAAGWDSIVGSMIPEEMIPEGFKAVLKSEKYQLILIMSEYMTASDEVNKQCDEIKNIIKKYDKSSMLIGEAPCTQDLITITNKDFKTVSAVSIVLIFIIIAAVLKSVSLPVILVIVIEFAIFINMGIPSYTGTVLSVYRLYRDRDHSAWSNRGLCNINDK